jgi:hypothetical protein
MGCLIYEYDHKFKFGGVTKTKNDIVVKSAHQATIKDYCMGWDDVSYVNNVDELEFPVFIKLEFLTANQKLKKLIKEYPNSVIYDPNAKLIIGANIYTCLNVCLFHGLTELVVPCQVKEILNKYQKKIFNKIFLSG